MTTIIFSQEPSDADAVLSSLKHDTEWLLSISNAEPASLRGREQELYSILNIMQWVASRFKVEAEGEAA
jgi:hypothetical protein